MVNYGRKNDHTAEPQPVLAKRKSNKNNKAGTRRSKEVQVSAENGKGAQNAALLTAKKKTAKVVG